MAKPATPDVTEETVSTRKFGSSTHVYKPYKAGIPPLGPYFREIWYRREFLMELSKTNVRSGQLGTVFGRAWNIINPLLMGLVYFMLVMILRGGRQGPEFFVYLIAGMFLYSMLTSSMTKGATSVTGNKGMLTGTAVPTALFPLAAVVTAIRKFLPTVIVLIIVGAITGVYPKMTWIAAVAMFFFMVVLAIGSAFFFATLQVYFRDTKEFLGYLTRIGLFCSPILWKASELPHALVIMQYINPAFDMIGGWSMAVVYGQWPTGQMWLGAALWSFGVLIVGFLFFVSRERDFAARI